jgi:hypothetical protein
VSFGKTFPVDTAAELSLILPMQTLGISDSADRSDGRLKSLFWPTIQSGADIDYLGAQGFWVCSFVGAISFFFSLLTGQYVLAAALLLFFHFGGVGVRERDLFAAAIVLTFYGIDTLISLTFLIFSTPWGMIAFRIVVCALLLSNLRATWIASHWEPTSENAALPPRFRDTWSDKLADLWPAWIWPKVRIGYYIFAFAVVLVFVLGVSAIVLRSMHRI